MFLYDSDDRPGERQDTNHSCAVRKLLQETFCLGVVQIEIQPMDPRNKRKEQDLKGQHRNDYQGLLSVANLLLFELYSNCDLVLKVVND
jgi:hypothetical protein